jgi:hypothetical protein
MSSYGKKINSWAIPNGIFNPLKKDSRWKHGKVDRKSNYLQGIQKMV